MIKFYGWEVSFQKMINKIRTTEMRYFVRNAYVGIVTSFTWACAPFMVAAVSFATFVLIDENNVLDAGTAFVSLTVFYLIRFPLAMLPTTISMITQANISLERIRSFLLLDETNDNDIIRDYDSGDSYETFESQVLSFNFDIYLRHCRFA